jgi:hypothetical protein
MLSCLKLLFSRDMDTFGLLLEVLHTYRYQEIRCSISNKQRKTLETMSRPFIVLDPVVVIGWGQVHRDIIDDAETRAVHSLNPISANAALNWLPALASIILSWTSSQRRFLMSDK